LAGMRPHGHSPDRLALPLSWSQPSLGLAKETPVGTQSKVGFEPSKGPGLPMSSRCVRSGAPGVVSGTRSAIRVAVPSCGVPSHERAHLVEVQTRVHPVAQTQVRVEVATRMGLLRGVEEDAVLQGRVGAQVRHRCRRRCHLGVLLERLQRGASVPPSSEVRQNRSVELRHARATPVSRQPHGSAVTSPRSLVCTRSHRRPFVREHPNTTATYVRDLHARLRRSSFGRNHGLRLWEPCPSRPILDRWLWLWCGRACCRSAPPCSPALRNQCSLCACRSWVCIVRPFHHTRGVPCAAPGFAELFKGSRLYTLALGAGATDVGPAHVDYLGSRAHPTLMLLSLTTPSPLLQPQGLEHRQRLQPRRLAPSTSARLRPPPPRRPPWEVSRGHPFERAGADTGGEEGCRRRTMQCSIHDVSACGSSLRPHSTARGSSRLGIGLPTNGRGLSKLHAAQSSSTHVHGTACHLKGIITHGARTMLE
jgi:hypothetical protein